jgi:hypothetical protein
LHDMRVASRRLRAAFSLFSKVLPTPTATRSTLWTRFCKSSATRLARRCSKHSTHGAMSRSSVDSAALCARAPHAAPRARPHRRVTSPRS